MRTHLLATSLAALALVTACGDDGGSTPIDAHAIDADPSAVNGCTPATALDQTAAGAARMIATVGLSYSPNCLRIKTGQSVTWNSAFQTHPLQGGRVGVPDATSPIGSVSSGVTKTIAFPAAGNYGYFCIVHTTLMMGAIYVEP